MPEQTPLSNYPVVVIGAGPVGLAAAAHLSERGIAFTVLEAGGDVASSVREWGHVHLFSPWEYNTDSASARLLEPTGWTAPDNSELPTGDDLVDQYLQPLAKLPAIAENLRFLARVTAISRLGVDRVRTAGRESAPLLVRLDSGEEILARAVIDASGTWTTPNVIGASGLRAQGEDEAASWITHALPDVFGVDRAAHENKHTVVVGAGHSAATSVLALTRLKDESPDTRITWAIRAQDPRRSYGGGDADDLPARGALGAGLQMQVDTGRVTLAGGFHTQSVRIVADGPDAKVELTSRSGETLLADRIISATGYRPDHSMVDELRLELDPILGAPRALAAQIDPNVHTCGTVLPHGIDQLAHPEPGYYVVGMKSYGRAPTFLMITGFEQVRSIVAALDGDWEAARKVHLVLPETGVCSATAGSEAIAIRSGMTREEHTQLLAAIARHVPNNTSAADAVMAAAAELGVKHSVALELAAFAAEQFDVQVAPAQAV